MKKVAIVTDSISTIPWQMAQKYGIEVVPLYVVMDGKDYPETEVDRTQLYDRIKRKDDSITTSSISPGVCLKIWRELSQEAESIIHIAHVPSMGTAYNVAVQTKEMAREEMPQTTVEVINSRNVCGAQLLVVLEAAKAANQGKNLTEVIEVANRVISRVSLIDLIPAPQQLIKEGRAVDKDGDETNNPIIMTQTIMEIADSTGSIMTAIGRARTRTKGMDKVVEIVKDRSKGGKLHVAINYCGAPNDAEELKKRFLSQFQFAELYIVEDSLVPLIHAGWGELKFGWYEE